MPNADLIRRTVKAIKEDRVRWHQQDWIDPPDEEEDHVEGEVPICGTTLCFAGFALVQVLGVDEFYRRALEFEDGRWWVSAWVGTGGLEVEATRVLGLSTYQAADIFGCMTDDLDVLKQRITDATGVTFP